MICSGMNHLLYCNIIMRIHNSIFYLLDYYYLHKYIEGRKSLRNKSINYFISNTFKRSNSNKKYNTLRPIYNAICSLFFKRNVVYLRLGEMKNLLDEIDKDFSIVPRKYHLEDFYKDEPMTAANYKSLMKYNFYDLLLFEYANHKDRTIIFDKMEEYNTTLRSCEFI